MILKFLSSLAILFATLNVFASVEIGVGQNSTFSGRFVPTLTAAYTTDRIAFSFYSSGVRNSYYYQSTYGAHFFRQKKVGDLFGGEIRCGFGLGLMYGARGLQLENQSSEREKNDIAIGPAFRVNWNIFPYTFVNFDATYGLRNFENHLLLNFQDIIVFSVGVRLW